MRVDYTKKRLTTLQVYYYVPDYTNIIQEFVWQYEDIQPKFPRTHTFLKHWHEHIDAVIQEVLLSHVNKYGAKEVRRVDAWLNSLR